MKGWKFKKTMIEKIQKQQNLRWRRLKKFIKESNENFKKTMIEGDERLN